MKKTSWFYRNFICGHHLTGQIKSEIVSGYRKRRYRECTKCGKKFYCE